MDFGNNGANNYVGSTHVFEKNRNLCSKAISEQTLVEEPIDWDDLKEIPLHDTDEETIITYDQAFAYFKETDLSEYNEKIVTTVEKSEIFSCFTRWRKSRLRPDPINDYNLLFLIAKCPYQKDNKIHVAMLRVVYDSLVLDKDLLFSWENIGFQSNLPWTDLRSIGMPGVLHLLYICTLCPLLRNMLYELSTNKFNTFPFAIHENFSDINKEGVFFWANKLYTAIFFHFGQIWRNQRRTILDMDSILKELDQSSLSKRARKTMVKNVNSFLKDEYNPSRIEGEAHRALEQ